MAVTMKLRTITGFYGHFGGTSCLHLQGRKSYKQRRTDGNAVNISFEIGALRDTNRKEQGQMLRNRDHTFAL
jgi:hypothetical protein